MIITTKHFQALLNQVSVASQLLILSKIILITATKSHTYHQGFIKSFTFQAELRQYSLLNGSVLALTLNNKHLKAAVFLHIPAISMCLSKFLTGALPVCVHASVREEVKRTEDGKRRRSAVSQCWMSKELMAAEGKTLGGMEPCTIQASFRWSAATGAKHPKSSAAHLKSTRADCICIGGCSNQIQTCCTHGKVSMNTVIRSISQIRPVKSKTST